MLFIWQFAIKTENLISSAIVTKIYIFGRKWRNEKEVQKK